MIKAWDKLDISDAKSEEIESFWDVTNKIFHASSNKKEKQLLKTTAFSKLREYVILYPYSGERHDD